MDDFRNAIFCTDFIKQLPQTGGPFIVVIFFICLHINYAAAADNHPKPGKTPDRIVTVGTDHDYPPFEYVDEQGSAQGFNIDLLKSIAETMGLTLKITTGPWKEIRSALENGQVNMVSGMYYSPERNMNVDFSVPFIQVHLSMFTRDDSGFHKISELKNKEIIVQTGDIMHDYVLSTQITPKIIEVDNTLDGIRLLASGKHDAALLPNLQGQYFLRKYDIANIRAVQPVILGQKYCFAVTEGDRELIDMLDQGLSILKASGKYREIREHWFGVLEGTNYPLHYRTVLGILLCLILMLLISWFWTWTLRRLVRKKTRQLADELSERKQAEKEKEALEERLRQVHKMEAIGTLAAGIAHDFNNILSAIVGYAQLARQETDSETRAYKDMTAVLESADRAKKLIGQILTYSRGTKQEQQAEHLSFLIKGGMQLLKTSLPANVEIITDLQAKNDLVPAYATQIHQILINLVINSAHAIGLNQGRIEIRLRNIELTQKTVSVPPLMPGTYVELTLTDTGHGIDKSIQERIFDPFFTTKQRGQGTGMGLSVVHGIVKDHGGQIQVKSRLNQGTSFHIIFPVYTGAQVEIDAPAPIMGGSERILFIDDEKDVVDVWERILTSLGYQVTASESPRTAMDLFQQSPEKFDVIITDLDMPQINGLSLIRAVKDIRPDIRIIVHSGIKTREYEQGAADLDITCFLQKPVSIEKMTQALQK